MGMLFSHQTRLSGSQYSNKVVRDSLTNGGSGSHHVSNGKTGRLHGKERVLEDCTLTWDGSSGNEIVHF